MNPEIKDAEQKSIEVLIKLEKNLIPICSHSCDL